MMRVPWRRGRGGAFFDYGVAVLAVALATAVRLALEPVLAGRSAFILFTLAVMASASAGGRRAGLLATVLGAIAAATFFFVDPYGTWVAKDMRYWLQTVLFLMVGGGMSYLAGELQRAGALAEQRADEAQKAKERAERAAEETAAALEHVRVLSGLLPICASCKKIRDRGGSWQQLEAYIRSHSEAEFTHGLCPDCAREYESQL
jgi:K+-sensing histidine kinase KdpD